MDRTATDLVRFLRDRTGPEPVRVALVLGSGLGRLAGGVAGFSIGYDQLPGFPATGVSGHLPHVTIGQFGGTRVAVLGGRAHYYETGDPAAMRLPLTVLKGLGAEIVILTNAAGSLDPAMETGSVMLIRDHINFSGPNPLIGEPDEARFVPMTDAYDRELRKHLRDAARATGTSLGEGVYAWYSGPSFETPAEIRAIRTLGADAVGMSTVPEVILARFLGLRVAALSTITNMAAGLSEEAIGHAHTKEMAPIGAAKIETVLRAALPAF
jgi:purine-nucleoside phosphorylase